MRTPFAESSETPPNDLAVVGENRHDPMQLLLLGADGHYYAYALPDGHPEEVEPGEDWEIEPLETGELFM